MSTTPSATGELASTDSPTPTISLQSALHAATRNIHTNLNKTITARLPLCTPPHTSNPMAYHVGMLMFGQIFLTFEAAIQDVLSERTSKDDSRSRHIQLLQTLQTYGLARMEALHRDFETLSSRLRPYNPEISTLESRIQNQAEEKTDHILRNIKSRPYLALAYTWTMYLALFNGGRWLHRQLASAGPTFWLEDDQEEKTIQALSFWRFDTTPHDPEAEDLKLEFKRNFEQASQMLTSQEQDEVVQEAVGIFELCLALIENLDVVMADLNQATGSDSIEDSSPSVLDGVVNSIWQTLSSNLLSPAYAILNSRWTRPIREEVKAVE